MRQIERPHWRPSDFTEVDEFLSEEGERVAVVIGENGSGKSFLLEDFSRHLVARGESVLLVSGTHKNRFTLRQGAVSDGYRQVDRTLINRRSRSPQDVLKKVIRVCCSDYEIAEGMRPSKEIDQRRFQVSTALEACGLKSAIGVSARWRDFDEIQVKAFVEDLRNQDGYSDQEIVRVSNSNTGIIGRRVNEFSHILLERDVREMSTNRWIDFEEANLNFDYPWFCFLLIRFEGLLKKHKIILGVELLVAKREGEFPVSQLSSGESAKIANLTYLASAVRRGLYVLIDEPETSLHPTWQKDYIDEIRAASGYFECKFLIATHSPLIVAGAKLGRIERGQNDAKIFDCEDFGLNHQPPNSLGVEALMESHFDVITPENHHLSKLLVTLLHNLEIGEVEESWVISKIKEYEFEAFDKRQEKIFLAARKMVVKISNQEDWHDAK